MGAARKTGPDAAKKSGSACRGGLGAATIGTGTGQAGGVLACDVRSTVTARAPADPREAAVWCVLASVPDPEIPVLSIVDLGIVRHVRWQGEELHVGITPTYSGCPATEVIRRSVEAALTQAGYTHAIVEDVLSPAWTSDWITEEGRRKLTAYGIAPPAESVSSVRSLLRPVVIACPRCGSRDTERVSEFGSTPCKAHYRCRACLEPFDYFKCI
jgi:ring-1,2-phenylacetyl-CoA epoxidase subunit PaaD